MKKSNLKRSLEAELLKIEKQDKIYGVGETRYDLMIKDVLNYIENSIPKKKVEEKIEETKLNKNHKYTAGAVVAIMNELQELLEEK